MSINHKLVPVDTTTDLETFLNFQGDGGRTLLNIYNNIAYFLAGNILSIDYKVVSLPNAISDVETTITTFGQSNWNFITLYNGNLAIFSRVAARLAFNL